MKSVVLFLDMCNYTTDYAHRVQVLDHNHFESLLPPSNSLISSVNNDGWRYMANLYPLLFVVGYLQLVSMHND